MGHVVHNVGVGEKLTLGLYFQPFVFHRLQTENKTVIALRALTVDNPFLVTLYKNGCHVQFLAHSPSLLRAATSSSEHSMHNLKRVSSCSEQQKKCYVQSTDCCLYVP